MILCDMNKKASVMGIEPTTFGLGGRCSTIELHGLCLFSYPSTWQILCCFTNLSHNHIISHLQASPPSRCAGCSFGGFSRTEFTIISLLIGFLASSCCCSSTSMGTGWGSAGFDSAGFHSSIFGCSLLFSAEALLSSPPAWGLSWVEDSGFY